MEDELVNGETEKKQSCSNKKKYIFIFSISLIIIICVVIALFFILRGKDEEECKTGYILINGKCKQYSFVATYYKDIIEDPV